MRQTAVAVLPSPDPFDAQHVSASLSSRARLAVLRRIGGVDDAIGPALDRWTELAASLLRTPVCLISLVGEDEQVLASRVGVDLERTPIMHSFCQYVVSGGAPLIVEDATQHPVLRENQAIDTLGVVAYAGVPVRVDGEVLGALCAIDRTARAWSTRDREFLCDLAEAVGADLRLRLQERELRRAHDIAAAHTRAHALIADDAPLPEVLQTVADAIEHFDPLVRASVLMLDQDAGTLHHAAGAKLPASYREAIDGVGIGPDVGSCGRAAALGVEVITPDIVRDPRWDAYAPTALAHDLRHCWSAPILDHSGTVLGTFALYGEAPREPDEDILDFLRASARLAGIAIERRRSAERLTHEATHDALTGLSNRQGLTERMAKTLERARRPITVLFVDLDRLKLVNDGLGHDAGDEVLRQVALRLRRAVRAEDLVARFGGDEFVVVPRRSLDERRVEQTARRLLREIERPVVLDGAEPVTVTASIGSVTIDPADVDVQEALRRADIAMYQVKSAGGGGYRPYVSVRDAQIARRLVLERELRGALDRDELRVVFQPIIRLSDGRVDGVEALLRWDSHRLGSVPPADFIPVAEETGLIAPIGDWVLRTACRAVAAYDGLRVNVNLSPRQLADPALPGVVAEALQVTGLTPDRLALELTETALLRADEATTAALVALEELGVELGLDDFGTGFSSLATLKEHPVHALKIDRMFVAGLGADAGDRAIVEAVIGMAHGMARPVTAEGVEHEGHLAILKDLGCDYAQGYLLGRPGLLTDAVGEPPA